MTDYENEIAWKYLKGQFKRNAPMRLIEGVAVSTSDKNDNGVSFMASGMEILKAPVPLLLEHESFRPLGRVLSAVAKGDRIHFTAEFAHEMLAPDQIWERVKSREVFRVSIGTRILDLSDQVAKKWVLDEISIVGNPADHLAYISKCFTRLPFISFRQPQESVIWSI